MTSPRVKPVAQGAAVATALAAVLWLGAGSHAEDQPATTSTRRSSQGVAGGEGGSAVQAKLDHIIENQERILKRLDEVMEELKIVKIRATLR